MMENEANSKKTPPEPVMVVPCQITSTVYQALAEANLVPRRWHEGGRYGSRTHSIDEDPSVRGLPILDSAVPDIEAWLSACRQGLEHDVDEAELPEWKACLKSNYSSITVLTDRPRVPYRVIPVPETIDATVHPERAPSRPVSNTDFTKAPQSFSFVELFAGIGGFAKGLEPLGGRCVFASEIDANCRAIYETNLDMSHLDHVAGDIWSIPARSVPDHDLLVAGFPCQPFSSLGDQLGFDDNSGLGGNRGMLFTQIVRILKAKRPKAFLLENVPGLMTTDGGRALTTIRTALQEVAGYEVTSEIVSSRALTAQSRKRLFLVGLRRPMWDERVQEERISYAFQFPYIPDLGLRAVDVLELDDEVLSMPQNSLYPVSEAQFHMLRSRKKSRWKPSKLAWPDTVCETLDAHYGTSIGRGSSQLVPCMAPRLPRKFTLRECGRLMGFPNEFQLPVPQSGNAVKAFYHMLGNAVCPPVVAAISGAILHHILPTEEVKLDGTYSNGTMATTERDADFWIHFGRTVAVRLALDAIRPDRSAAVAARIRAQYGNQLILHS